MAVTVGIAMKCPEKESKQFLMVLMDTVEEEVALIAEMGQTVGGAAALKTLARDLADRAKAADKPHAEPTATMGWATSTAPRVAGALHAVAVLLDAVCMYEALDPLLLELQRTAHERSRTLAGQLAHVF